MSNRVSRKEFWSESNLLYVQPTSSLLDYHVEGKSHDSHHYVISCSQDFSEESGLEGTL